MNTTVDDFLNRLFRQNKSQWWNNLNGETRQGRQGRFLQETLGNELDDIPGYRKSERQLFFFSQSRNSTIDGLYEHIGVEEKCNNLSIDEDLSDGAIHRGIVWNIGNPQRLSAPKLEAVTLYVVRNNSVPISEAATDLYFPVLLAIWKIDVHVVFVNENTGEYWKVAPAYEKIPIPQWLSVKEKPKQWDKQIEEVSVRNKMALNVLKDETKLAGCEKRKCLITEFNNNRAQYLEVETGNGTKAAIMDYGNEWRLIELGLLLRSKGYDAVKVVYNSNKHKNAKSRGRRLIPAGKMVEKKIFDYMLNSYSLIIDWGVPLDELSFINGKMQNSKTKPLTLQDNSNDKTNIITKDKKINKTLIISDDKRQGVSIEKIIWDSQAHVIDSCIKFKKAPDKIAKLLVEHHYYSNLKDAEKRVKRHLATDTKSKRLGRNIITQSEYYEYLKIFNLPLPKTPYS